MIGSSDKSVIISSSSFLESIINLYIITSAIWFLKFNSSKSYKKKYLYISFCLWYHYTNLWDCKKKSVYTLKRKYLVNTSG